jgi:hypothetical protein
MKNNLLLLERSQQELMKLKYAQQYFIYKLNFYLKLFSTERIEFYLLCSSIGDKIGWTKPLIEELNV